MRFVQSIPAAPRTVGLPCLRAVGVVIVSCCGLASAAVRIDYVPVGNAGNAADPTSYRQALGPVANAYAIGKYEVTNAQYAEFLNSVDPAAANARALYESHMSTNKVGGIDLVVGNAAGARYVARAGRENTPVTYVSFW